MDESTILGIARSLATAGYPHRGEDQLTFIIAIEMSPQAGQPMPSPSPVFHFLSDDRKWKVSVSREYLALTTQKYTNWPDFAGRLRAVSNAYFENQPACRLNRVGLRYKDLIEREPIGLAGVPWDELIQDFLLGPLAPNSLADGQRAKESDADAFMSQSMLRLSDAKVLLTSALLKSANDQSQRAFLIDADFFNEGDFLSDMSSDAAGLTRDLEALHSHAGALFKRSIKDKLHDALRPS